MVGRKECVVFGKGFGCDVVAMGDKLGVLCVEVDEGFSDSVAEKPI